MMIPFLLWFVLALAAQGIAAKSKNKKFLDCENYFGGMFFAGCLAVVVFIIILVTNLISYSEQRSLFNNLQNLTEQRVIYDLKMVNMTAQYKEVLINDYTSYEKGIFSDMKPDDASKLQTLLSVYPQLKASVTVAAYADNIKELNDAIYKTDLDIRETVKSIRWNYMTPWCITSFMPSVPPHLAKYVNL
ncbi:MAG: hypothetical protein WCN92_02895 [Eubacteriales bacterium]